MPCINQFKEYQKGIHRESLGKECSDFGHSSVLCNMLLSDICVYLNEIIPFILGDPYNFIDGAICIEMSHRCLSLYGPLAISEPAHRLRGSMAGIQLSFRLNNHDIKIVDNLFVHFLKISNIVSSTWGQKRFKCCP